MSRAKPSASTARIVLVTGMSGAGKTSALKALEDLGYEAVDNLPLSLVQNLIEPADAVSRPLAIGVDIRTRDFAVESFLATFGRISAGTGPETRLLFIDCDSEVLRRRFTETRRRHPLASDRPVTDGIRHEREMLAEIKNRADVVIDTTGYQPAELRQDVGVHFGEDVGAHLAIFVTSFAYRYGLPRQADLVFDVRFLRNPHYEEDLQALSGTDDAVAAYVAADPDFESFFSALTGMLQPLLPRFDAEGKSYLTIAIGCTGGRHRSVFVAERLAAWLAEQGCAASCHHRDIFRVG